MPTPSQVHINGNLSTFASGYKPGSMIAADLCPNILVAKRDDSFFQKTRADVSTPLDDEIGPKGTVSEVDYTQTPASYKVRDYGLMGVVSNEEIDNADEPMAPLEERVQNLTYRLWLKHEMRVAAVLDTNASYLAANVIAGTAAWSNKSTSDPIKDIQTAVAVIAPGAEDDTELVMGLTLELWQALSRHPDLLGLRAGGGSEKGVLKMEEVAAQLGLDRIVVSSITKNTANRGLATPVYARVWDATKARIVRRPKGEPKGRDAMCFAANFALKKNGPELFRVYEWAEPKIGVSGSVGVRVAGSEHAARIIQNDMAAIITGVG